MGERQSTPRCIDDCMASRVNLAATVDRRLMLHSAADLAKAVVSLAPSGALSAVRLIKSELHSAYRCRPVTTSDGDLSDTLVHKPFAGALHVPQQLAMPSGAPG